MLEVCRKSNLHNKLSRKLGHVSEQLPPTAHMAAEWMRILTCLADPAAFCQPPAGPAYEAMQGAEGGPGKLKLLSEFS